MWSLTFSDSAKFAQAAVNLVTGRGFVVSHSFFNPVNFTRTYFEPEFSVLPSLFMVMPAVILGRYDSSIILPGILLLFLTCLVVYIITRRLSDRVTGILATIIFITSPEIIS